ncbi:MAG: hypothetical protein V3W19_14985 [Desulfatiglandales bacterium]
MGKGQASHDETYFMHSGEGEQGAWEVVITTELGIKQRLTRERCSGQRWAKAYHSPYKLADGSGYAAYEVGTDEVRRLPPMMPPIPVPYED